MTPIEQIRELACFTHGEKYGELAMRLDRILKLINEATPAAGVPDEGPRDPLTECPVCRGHGIERCCGQIIPATYWDPPECCGHYVADECDWCVENDKSTPAPLPRTVGFSDDIPF